MEPRTALLGDLRVDRIRRWWTPRGFECAHRLAAARLTAEGETAPRREIARLLDREPRQVRRWCLADVYKPHPRSMRDVDEVFSTILGDNWLDIVQARQAEEAKRKP